MAAITKPVPRPAPESEPYWRAARKHRLELPQCDDCGSRWFPPSRFCPHCLSANNHWRQVSGRGRIFSFVIYDRVYHLAFEADVPYVVALIELEEGPRLLSNVIGTAPDDVRCDMPVEVVFDDVGDATIPKFRVTGRQPD
jgi:uncharacterized OB-fold protein